MGTIINVPDLYEVHRKLDALIKVNVRIMEMLQASAKKEKIMTQQLDELTAAVEENTVLDNSIIQLVDGLAAQILALKDDPAKLSALAASLKASSAAVAAAIQANTPGEEPPAEV